MPGHTPQPYQLPDETSPVFARTNAQTIAQRMTLLHELLPRPQILDGVLSIGQRCAGVDAGGH
jgi:hypothetical protein